ncbi:MAG: cytochrome c3 family protein [Candidatus Aminicenantes bacterium]|nr:MAG: cytochrome c3 family protein [Candidatus Aminicenantes bacterium]
MKKTKILNLFFIIFPLLLSFAVAQSNEDCETCHSDPELTARRQGRTISMYVDFKRYSDSVHKDSDCIDCHQDADVEEFPHPEVLEKVNCGMCHDVADEEFYAGIHGRALRRGAPYAPTCNECHGEHYILPPTDVQSRTYKMNIPVLCGKCHREGAPVARVYNIPEHDILSNYSQSIHGEGLFRRGLIVTATCNDCHGNHLVLPHTNVNSTVSARNIARTCTQCHARIEEVHTKIIRGELWETEPGAIPACTDCHLPHTISRTSLVLGTSDRECLKCHETEDVYKTVEGEQISMTVPKEDLQNSEHRNIPCVKCHTDIDPQRQRPCETAGQVDCSNCHAQMAEDYFESSHGMAYVQKNPNAPYCSYCHGTHKVLSHLDERDKTYRSHIPDLCGDCHGKIDQSAVVQTAAGNALVDYSSSVHGQGLIKKGLLPSAVCTDCHSTHLELKHDDERSSTYYNNLPSTCATCHKGIYDEYADSIHHVSRTEEEQKLPTCEDCHSSHQIKQIEQDQFMAEVTHQCGTCHEDLSETYTETIHGKAYTLGYLKAAKCSDCHGAHETRKVDNPDSLVGFNRVVETCQKCHPDANRRFTGYLTHATHHDKQKYPILYFTFWAMTSLLIVVFGFFGFHTLLWMPRSYKHLKEKRKAEKIHKRYYIQRFTTDQRIMHIFVILSFMGLALTGMMLKFANMPWAKTLADLFGGVEAAGRIHRISAAITFGYFFVHLFSMVRSKMRTKTSWRQVIFGKRSLWFNKKDLKDFIGSMKWFLGLGPRPEYGRWTYWEKFDYMAVFWGVGVIGLSGLILWFPEFFTKLLPGWLINVAMIIHSDEALLAVGFIFTIHFFNTHLRPESFPLDPVIFTGLVSLDEYKEDRPEEYKHLKESGQLKKAVQLREISPRRMLAVRIFGYSFLLLGICLIVLIIYSMLFGYK